MAEAEELKGIECEKAKRSSQANLKQGATRPDVATFPPREAGKTRDKVASAVGLGSGRNFDKAEKVWQAAQSGNERAKELMERLDR